MADIFQSAPGTVAVISSDTALPGSIVISQPQFPSGGIAAIITGINLDQKTNQQFQQSLDGAVYIYVFGDQMGDISVEGIAFPKLCQGGRSGLFDVSDYYANNRASKTSTPIIVSAGGQNITGFLTGIRIRSNVSGEDPVALINNYSLHISALPQK
jgi:hypothetical protein